MMPDMTLAIAQDCEEPIRVRLMADYTRTAPVWSLYKSRTFPRGTRARVVGRLDQSSVTLLLDEGFECQGPNAVRFIVLDQHQFVDFFERIPNYEC